MNNFECVKEFNRAFDMVSKEPQTYIGFDEDELGFIKINPFKNRRQKIFESYSLIRLRLNLMMLSQIMILKKHGMLLVIFVMLFMEWLMY